MTEAPSILAVFAHPDDETYGPGGTIARYALEGVAVDLLVFTCGEAGTIGISKELSAVELCRRRRAELAAACDALGVRHHRVVGAPDRRVEETKDDDGALIVLREIELRRPAVLLTFHRLGVSGHPDHLAVTRFTAEAFRRAGASGPAKMYEWAVPESRVPLYGGRRLIPAPDDEITTTIAVPDAAMDRKLDAIARHETQIEFYHELVRLFGDYRKATAEELFVLRAVRGGAPAAGETDLFEGLR